MISVGGLTKTWHGYDKLLNILFHRNLGVGMGAIAARVATILAPQFVYWASSFI